VIRIKKLLVIGIIALFIVLEVAPSINANICKESDKNQVIKMSNSDFGLGYEIWIRPCLKIFIFNDGDETFRGNISLKFTINATIMIFGGNINFSDFYVELEPQDQILLYKGLVLGFGPVKAVFDMPPPGDHHFEYEGFLFLFFLFLRW